MKKFILNFNDGLISKKKNILKIKRYNSSKKNFPPIPNIDPNTTNVKMLNFRL